VDGRTYVRTYGHLRPTLLGRLRRVDLQILVVVIIATTSTSRSSPEIRCRSISVTTKLVYPSGAAAAAELQLPGRIMR